MNERILMSKALKDPNFLGSHDIVIGEKNEQPVYGELTVTIKDIQLQEITDMELIKSKKKNANGKQTKMAYVMTFKEPGVKPFVVKAASVIKGIEKATGTKIVKHWIGKQITFYVEQVKAFGEMHDALRVRPFQNVKAVTYKCSKCPKDDVDETTAVYSQKMFGFVTCKDCGAKLKAEQEQEAKQAEAAVSDDDVPS